MIELRSATESDIDTLIKMISADLACNYHRFIRPSAEQLNKTLKSLLLQPGGLVLLAMENDNPLGAVAALRYDHPISGEPGVGMLFWWTEPEARGGRGPGLALFRKLESWSKEGGAKWLQVVAPTKDVAACYQTLGYEVVEAAYQRRFE